jgi:hypothetical protein
MRPANYGRIILVSCTGGLHGDIGLSAYAASKGGLLAFGRSLAAEGASRGVLTNMLLPYALTQITDDGMPSQAKEQMDPEAVAPVLTALASKDCRLNSEYIVTGGGRLRRASVVEWGTVELPADPDLSPEVLAGLLSESHRGEPREFTVSVDAFADLMDGSSRDPRAGGRAGELGTAAGHPGGVRGHGRRRDACDLLVRHAHQGARDHGHDLAARARGDRGGLLRPVGGARGFGPAGAGAGADRDLGAAAGRAHLRAQLRAGRGQAVRLAAATEPGQPGHVRAALHLLGARAGHVVRVAPRAGGHVHPCAGVGGGLAWRGGVGGGVRLRDGR